MNEYILVLNPYMLTIAYGNTEAEAIDYFYEYDRNAENHKYSSIQAYRNLEEKDKTWKIKA